MTRKSYPPKGGTVNRPAKQNLNCIVPDLWMTDAVIAALESPGYVFNTGGTTVQINGQDRFKSVDQTARSLSSRMTDHLCAWVRLKRCQNPRAYKREHLRLVTLAVRLGIPHSPASIRTTARRGFIASRTVYYRAGIIVEIKHLCELLMAYRPDLLEVNRNAIYNRDDGRYE